MGSLLVELWLGDTPAIEIVDAASASLARQQVRAVGKAAALPTEQIEAAATCASELVTNLIRHGRSPRVFAAVAFERAGYPGIEVVAADAGPGIARPDDALAGAAGSAAGGLGIGLASVRRLADELDVDVRLGEGTCIRARKLAPGAPRRREITVLGRPCPGFMASGDGAVVVRDGERLLLAVCDGLGHGIDAQRASMAALAQVRAAAAGTPRSIVERVATELRAERGCVLGIAGADEAAGTLDHAIVGDISGVLAQPGNIRKLHAARGFLGRGAAPLRVSEHREPLATGDVLCMYTDGIRDMDLTEDRSLLAQSSLAIAAWIANRYAKDLDDALVLVAR